MSEQNLKFENFFPRQLAFADKAHELEMMSKWNDAKITWETSLEAATAEANERIAKIESEVAELKAELKSEKEHSNILLKNGGEFYRNELALKAHINTLREALEASDDLLRKLPNSGEFYGLAIMENNQLVLSATPAESMQAHDDEVIEMCAKVADAWENISCKDKIRALKEVK